jgi:hypothetical protein
MGPLQRQTTTIFQCTQEGNVVVIYRRWILRLQSLWAAEKVKALSLDQALTSGTEIMESILTKSGRRVTVVSAAGVTEALVVVAEQATLLLRIHVEVGC